MKCDPNGIKIVFFFQKIINSCTAAGSQPPSVIPNDWIKLLCSPCLPILKTFLSFDSSPSLFSKTQATCQFRPRILIFYSTVSLSHKKSFFRKFLMTSLRVICGLPPSNQKFWLRLCTSSMFFFLNFNHRSSKNLMVFELSSRDCAQNC